MKEASLHQLIWMSRPLMQAAEACVGEGLKGTGLTVRMRAVLEILHRHGEQTVPEIAFRLEINRQYVQLMCNETLAAGLTENRNNPRHKRSPKLALSDSGRVLIKDILAMEMALMKQVGEGLTEDEIVSALSVVAMVTDRLKETIGDIE